MLPEDDENRELHIPDEQINILLSGHPYALLDFHGRGDDGQRRITGRTVDLGYEGKSHWVSVLSQAAPLIRGTCRKAEINDVINKFLLMGFDFAMVLIELKFVDIKNHPKQTENEIQTSFFWIVREFIHYLLIYLSDPSLQKISARQNYIEFLARQEATTFHKKIKRPQAENLAKILPEIERRLHRIQMGAHLHMEDLEKAPPERPELPPTINAATPTESATTIISTTKTVAASATAQTRQQATEPPPKKAKMFFPENEMVKAMMASDEIKFFIRPLNDVFGPGEIDNLFQEIGLANLNPTYLLNKKETRVVILRLIYELMFHFIIALNGDLILGNSQNILDLNNPIFKEDDKHPIVALAHKNAKILKQKGTKIIDGTIDYLESRMEQIRNKYYTEDLKGSNKTKIIEAFRGLGFIK